MKNTTKPRTLSWINNQYSKNNISFSHKLQRPVDQWNIVMKSLLIHSLLTGIPVNPIYLVEENNVMYTLDGSQRVSTCIQFLQNDFALNKYTPNIKLTVVENGEKVEKEFELAKKRFSALDEDVQETLRSATLDFCMLSDYTDDEVKMMFERQNSGKKLSAKLLRVCKESDDFSDMVYSLANHPVMNKLMTPAQRKSGTDRDIIIQTIMLIATNQEHQFTSFRAKDIDNFVMNYADEYLDVKDTLEEAMDKLDTAYDKISIPVTSLPQILYACYKVTKNKKSFSALIDQITEFLNTYNENEEYKLFVQSGTTSAENVDGRFQYWRAIVNELN